jgi:hypothetical protein
MSQIMQYLTFCAWLITFNVIGPRFTYAVQIIGFHYKAQNRLRQQGANISHEKASDLLSGL